jgi:carbon monoxide dehydrogenase subunit G
MEMTGEYRIAAPRAQVWAALNNPEILKASIPGCEALEMTSETEMTAKVVTKIGPVKATFTGKVKLENMNPPEGYTISGEGQGGVAGFAKGGADVKLTEDGAETVLAYTARAQIGGKLAQLGARLIDSTAKMMADQFFAKFSAIVAAEAAPAGDAAVAPETAGEPAEAIAAIAEPVAAASAAAATSAAATASAASTASRPAQAQPAAAPASSGLNWVVPIVTLIAGIIIGKYLLH